MYIECCTHDYHAIELKYSYLSNFNNLLKNVDICESFLAIYLFHNDLIIHTVM